MSDALLGFIGAIIGGGITLFGVWLTTYFTKKESIRTEKESIKAFLQAIDDELTILWDLYFQGAGTFLESTEEGKPFLYHYIVEQDYFIIYNKNSNLLGKIQDELLRKQIVLTYTKAKAIVDSYTLNNKMLDQYLNMILLFQQTKLSEFQANSISYNNALIEYSTKLKIGHNSLKEELCKLQSQIKIYLNPQ
ncbi:MAG: hypothetical protein KA253_00940 [Campylobacteraceae bacterium]|nr:hypothetical protein [Campylobacteraceae bacterium]